MRSSKLVSILKELTKNELQEFKDFVQSPFFNKNKKCVELYDLLLRYSPDFTDQKIDSPHFTKDIYSNKRSLDTVLERLLRLLEEYLVQQRFRNQEELRKYFLLENLRARGKQKHYNLIHKRATNKLRQKKENNQTLYGTYLFEMSLLEMYYQQKKSQENKAEQLKKTINAFDKYLLSLHLWFDNAILSTRKIGSDFARKTTEKIVVNSKIFTQLANQEPYNHSPLIQLRLSLNKLHEYDHEENFEELFNSIKSNHRLISDSDNRYFYKSLVNYSITKVIEGNHSYYGRLLDVYIFTMEIGVLIEGQYLHPLNMKNIVVTSIKANKIDLAYRLLDKYLPSIHPQYQDVTVAYCRGYLYFQQKNYETASDFLRQCVEMKNLFELDAQSILYKIYYETNEDWAFDIPVQSFIAKLSRHGNRHPQYIIKGYISFFRILKQVYQKKVNPKYKKTINDIEGNIGKMKYLSDKQWLLEKLAELELKSS